MRIFPPKISPPITTTIPVHIPAAGTTANAQGKEKVTEPAMTEAPSKEVTFEDISKQEMEEILKII